MRVYHHPLCGAPRPIYVPETQEDLEAFLDWAATPRRAIAVDTETTGLDIYTPGFEVRLVQFGDHETAWVLRTDVPAFREASRTVLAGPAARLVLHNATFDLLALDHVGIAPLEATFPKSFDTRTLAHLLDPRGKEDGGLGHALKDLAAHHVDPDAPDGDKALQAVFREHGWKAAEGWRLVPIDHPDYLVYAGLDVILTARLFDVLGPEVHGRGLSRLAAFEHRLAFLLARLERRGFRLDVPYTSRLLTELQEDAERWAAEAALWGVENVNSPAQVSAALLGMGETLTERTPSGDWKVDKGVLLPLADLDMDWSRIGAREPNPLAEAVLHAKRSAKWATSYAEAMLHLRDATDRIHPKINALQARTARMSVSRPPLQQLPAGDWKVRRCLVADPGHVIVAADYAQVELRVLAALAEERKMMAAIEEGVDLHDLTASAIWGPDFTAAQRKLAKTVGFGKVYGGGVVSLARQAGAPESAVREAVAAYDRNFPGIRRFARRLQERAEWGRREVVTPSGRRLPLDRDRLYAATNYAVQSTARDVLAQALLDLEDAGLADTLLIPVHDEVIAQAPEAEAEDLARALAKTMSMDFMGVRLDAEAEVYGPSWGHGYGAPE